MEDTLKYLIRESECEILVCEGLKEKYKDNLQLTQMYTLKQMHYEFMICRLRRHLTTQCTPKPYCENAELPFHEEGETDV